MVHKTFNFIGSICSLAAKNVNFNLNVDNYEIEVQLSLKYSYTMKATSNKREMCMKYNNNKNFPISILSGTAFKIDGRFIECGRG